MKEEEQAIKVINKRTERLLKELEIEKEDFSDEPKIAYLMQEIRANKTVLNLIETQKAELEPIKKLNIPVETLVAEWERLNNIEDNTIMLKAEIERLEKQSKNLDKEAQAYLEQLAGDSGMKERTIALLQAEIEKKDKTIYKMASYIAQLDIDDDICSTVGTKDCDKMAFCECEDCIIEYFTKLAEEEK